MQSYSVMSDAKMMLDWPRPENAFMPQKKQEIANSLHTTCAQEKSVQTCVGFSDKCLDRCHTKWMRMTPTPCPTRHLSHH